MLIEPNFETMELKIKSEEALLHEKKELMNEIKDALNGNYQDDEDEESEEVEPHSQDASSGNKKKKRDRRSREREIDPPRDVDPAGTH